VSEPCGRHGGGGATAPDPAREAAACLAARLDARGRAPALLLRAVTHPSYAHEHPGQAHNEALAFVGDAVIGLLVGETLYRAAPDSGPGPLTQARAEVVSARGLAAWARILDLGPCLRLGRGEEQAGGRDKDSILGSALEAVVGALYLDGGLDAVAPLVRRLMNGERGPGAIAG
jgi:ribonuclease-3